MSFFQYVKNHVKIVEQISRFLSFVHSKDGRDGAISFRDSTGFLGREEDYKSRIAEAARLALDFNSWEESWIGTGRIAQCAVNAMKKAGNLVNVNQQIDFQNRLDPTHPKFKQDAEMVLYKLYRDPRLLDADIFSEAVATFGAKYDTIAFLFFVKDDTRFLPISTGHFDIGFSILDIDYTTSRLCAWDNYKGYLEISREIRDLLEAMLPMYGTPRLIDAHSFVWIIQEDQFLNWYPAAEELAEIEETAERCIEGESLPALSRRYGVSSHFIRNADIVAQSRNRAHGICQLCEQPAPFIDKNGEPYLEVHHIVWLSRGGSDTLDNTAALCPNCHSRMHHLDKPEDVEKLKAVRY